jgi:hypothetical protein
MAQRFRLQPGPDTFMVIEKWASLERCRRMRQRHTLLPTRRARPHIANRVVHVLSSAL